MNTIILDNLLPRVFAQSHDLQSDVWGRSVRFERGRSCLIEAASGRGKSTLCSYLLGYRRDYTGRLLFDGNDARSLSVAAWSGVRRHCVSCVFQELRLFPELTALENVELKNRLTHHKSRSQIEEWFGVLGLADKLHAPVAQLSWGQQQRVALMRALVQPFDFLLADEPASHVDDANAEAMARLLAAEVEAQGAALIVTSIGRRLPMNYDTTLSI